jgi:hypothetical protein
MGKIKTVELSREQRVVLEQGHEKAKARLPGTLPTGVAEE